MNKSFLRFVVALMALLLCTCFTTIAAADIVYVKLDSENSSSGLGRLTMNSSGDFVDTSPTEYNLAPFTDIFSFTSKGEQKLLVTENKFNSFRLSVYSSLDFTAPLASKDISLEVSMKNAVSKYKEATEDSSIYDVVVDDVNDVNISIYPPAENGNNIIAAGIITYFAHVKWTNSEINSEYEEQHVGIGATRFIYELNPENCEIMKEKVIDDLSKPGGILSITSHKGQAYAVLLDNQEYIEESKPVTIKIQKIEDVFNETDSGETIPASVGSFYMIDGEQYFCLLDSRGEHVDGIYKFTDDMTLASATKILDEAALYCTSDGSGGLYYNYAREDDDGNAINNWYHWDGTKSVNIDSLLEEAVKGEKTSSDWLDLNYDEKDKILLATITEHDNSFQKLFTLILDTSGKMKISQKFEKLTSGAFLKNSSLPTTDETAKDTTEGKEAESGSKTSGSSGSGGGGGGCEVGIGLFGFAFLFVSSRFRVKR